MKNPASPMGKHHTTLQGTLWCNYIYGSKSKRDAIERKEARRITIWMGYTVFEFKRDLNGMAVMVS
jgi:hypothetical protein